MSVIMQSAGFVGREKLTADRTYYVRTDGSDSNNGFTDSAGGAFATWQFAVNRVSRDVDTQGYTVTVEHGNEGAGVKTFSSSGSSIINFSTPAFVGGGTLILSGNATDLITPANCVLSSTSASCLLADTGVLGLSIMYVSGLKLTTVTSGNCIQIGAYSDVFLDGMEFGAAADAHIALSGSAIMGAGDYNISGSASYHADISLFGLMYWIGTATLTGTPAFTTFVNASSGGNAQVLGGAFSGGATGKRYFAELNSVINTTGGGANFFPGNSAGSTATGGQYA